MSARFARDFGSGDKAEDRQFAGVLSLDEGKAFPTEVKLLTSPIIPDKKPNHEHDAAGTPDTNAAVNHAGMFHPAHRRTSIMPM